MSLAHPDDPAAAAHAAGPHPSRLTQEAIAAELASRATDGWLDGLDRLPTTGARHLQVLDAVHAARDELEHGG